MKSLERTMLNLSPNLPDPDDFYNELLHAHEGLSDADSADLNARLILILCNQIGDRTVICEALQAARDTHETGENDHSPDGACAGANDKR